MALRGSSGVIARLFVTLVVIGAALCTADIASADLEVGVKTRINGTRPEAGVTITQHDGLSATTSPGRYVAWKVTVADEGPDTFGFVDATMTGASDGSATAFFIGDHDSWMGSVDSPAATVGAQAADRNVSEGIDTNGGSQVGGSLHAGDYHVVYMVGGQTGSAGLYQIKLNVSPNATVEWFGSGPVTQYSDIDFMDGPAAVSAGPVDGSIEVPITQGFFGGISTFNATATVGITDLSGETFESQSVALFDQPPGTYTLHAHAASVDTVAPIVALVADIDL
jgi:hypothetical protein